MFDVRKVKFDYKKMKLIKSYAPHAKHEEHFIVIRMLLPAEFGVEVLVDGQVQGVA